MKDCVAGLDYDFKNTTKKSVQKYLSKQIMFEKQKSDYKTLDQLN